MFDATKGQKAHDDQVDKQSDTFAMLFGNLDNADKLEFLDRAIELLRSKDSVAAFNSGTYAQDSSGQPAKALGGGTQPSPNDLQEALNVIMAAPGATDGQKAAMTRVFFPGPDHINVQDDGTPTELVNARNQRSAAETDKQAAETALADAKDKTKQGSIAFQLDKAQKDLADATDKTKPGSLAHKLAEAEQELKNERDGNHAGSLRQQLDAAQATPADSVRKADLEPVVTDALVTARALKGPAGTKVSGKDALVEKLEDTLEMVKTTP